MTVVSALPAGGRAAISTPIAIAGICTYVQSCTATA